MRWETQGGGSIGDRQQELTLITVNREKHVIVADGRRAAQAAEEVL
jgi:hypothetical protein